MEGKLNTNNYVVTHIKSMLLPQDHVAYSIAQNDRRLYERIMKEKKTGVQPMTQLHRSPRTKHLSFTITIVVRETHAGKAGSILRHGLYVSRGNVPNLAHI